MSEKVISEREAVLRERAAWTRGNVEPLHGCNRPVVAAKRYPLPKVMRPRTAIDPRNIFAAFRASDNKIQFRRHGSTQWSDYDVDESLVRLWSDLLENPDDEVEDTGLDAERA